MLPLRLFVSGRTIVFATGLLLGLSGCTEYVPTGPNGYSIAATALNPATVTAGNTTTSTLTLTPTSRYSGAVTLSCASSTGTNAPACAFSPNPVMVSGGVVTSTLTVSTNINTPGGSYALSVTGADASGLAPMDGPQPLTLTAAAVIQHVVVIVQENRTPDNLFQGLCIPPYGSASACGTGPGQYDIVQQGTNSTGETITLAPVGIGTESSIPETYFLNNSHAAFRLQYDLGKLDGADRTGCTPKADCPANPQFMYVNPSDAAPYLTLAQQYTLADRMFQTNEGPSFPAHQIIFSGTSAPSPPGTEYGSYLASEDAAGGVDYGCIATSVTTVALISPTGVEDVPGPYPCYNHASMSDVLDAKGITWRFYAPSAGSGWTAPDALVNLCQAETVNNVLTCTGPEWTNHVVIPEQKILTDISNGNLQQVSWVVPHLAFSDHPGYSNGDGPSWVAAIVNAIGSSPYWANTAILITWDDWGGWYDHVAPKVVDDGVSWGSGDVYGFRVPLLVVSPYAKAGYPSHVTHDFGSMVHFIESTYGLASLGFADANADDLSDCFDLTQPPIPFQTIDAPVDPTYFLNYVRPDRGDPDDQ